MKQKNVVSRSGRYFLSYTVIVILSSFIWRTYTVLHTSVPFVLAWNSAQLANPPCPLAPPPANQSLLVVLLERAVSLSTTDSEGYSTSVTKMLADLWPGKMAVIPFGDDSLHILGPEALSDTEQQAFLKSQIQDYPIEGNQRFLNQALSRALDLLQSPPSGSRIIVIADGNDDSPLQEQDIHNKLIPQFCKRGIPISTFGLSIDQAKNASTDTLLVSIAKDTGASYTNTKPLPAPSPKVSTTPGVNRPVSYTEPEDLPSQIIRLYSQWRGLSLIEVQPQGPHSSNYPVPIDAFIKNASIISIRSASTYNITVSGPNHRQITQGMQSSTDQHYQIDSFDVSGAFVSGIYTVNTDDDPNALVYALVNSPLKIQLVQPTASTLALTNQPVPLQSQFINDSGPLPIQTGTAGIVAYVALWVDGRPVTETNAIGLTLSSPLFIGGTIVYNQPGQLRIELQGNYRGALRQTSFTLPLKSPSPGSTPLPPKPDLLEVIEIYVLPSVVILVLVALLYFNRRNLGEPGMQRRPRQ